MNRLVLGYGAVGQSFLERLAGQPGALTVLVDGAERAASLRDSGIDARNVDITDVDDIRTVAGADAESVVVAPAGTDTLGVVARTARDAYPDAFLLACAADPMASADRESLSRIADRVVDLPAELSRSLVDRFGDGGIRTRKLQETLAGLEGPLAIVTHDNPDPDAIGAAVGLERIAAEAGTDAEVCYYGEIRHQENRALVNLLGFELRNLDSGADLSTFGAFALVDHSRPGINDGLARETPIDIVIDHHPPREPIRAQFVDLRSDVGATCTLVAGYLSQLGIDPGTALASGLLYGIRTDTNGFTRGVSIADFEAAAGLIEIADGDRLRRIESPNVSIETMETIGEAISSRTVEDDVLTSCVGPISNRDTLSQAADKLLEMEGITTTLVFGYTDETVFVSARSRGVDRDLGEVLRESFGQIGSAGGHAKMAGAQIPIGILTDETEPEDVAEVITDVITDRFFEAIGITPNYAAAYVYSDQLESDRESSR